MISLERVYLLNEGSQDAGSKTLTLKKKCESIKPYALCYATDMAFFGTNFEEKESCKNYDFTYIFFVIDF